jgi:hypothetical protein
VSAKKPWPTHGINLSVRTKASKHLGMMVGSDDRCVDFLVFLRFILQQTENKRLQQTWPKGHQIYARASEQL